MLKKIVLIFWVAAFFLSGCVTVPTKETLPTYNIGGITYLPLISLCELKGINWDYDTFTRTAVLTKDSHKINLMVGENLVLIDGSSQHLRYPPVIHQGTVAVPYKFKEEIIDTLFKESQPPPQAALSLSPIKKIVIDAGHGGTDPGAIGRTGLREKIVVLDIAKRLSNLLRADGLKVVMTRTADTPVSLLRRVEIANNSQVDLFISIHANANRVRSLNGFEVYYISPNIATDYQRAIDTARDAHLNLDNSYFANHSLDLEATLWDMIYTYNRAESFGLARSLCRMANSNLNVRMTRIKGANFYVLKGVRMPAVLIEVGFLSNHNEELKLKNNYYRQQIAEAIKQGIQDYAQGLVFAQVPK